MKTRHAFAVLLVLAGLTVAAYAADKKADSGRTLAGRVIDKQDNPLPDAVVFQHAYAGSKELHCGARCGLPFSRAVAEYRLLSLCPVQRQEERYQDDQPFRRSPSAQHESAD